MRHFSSAYLLWLNDPVVCAENRHAVFPYTEEQMLDYLRKAPMLKNDLLFAIRLKKTSKHVGNISLGGISWVNRSAEIAILIGDRGVWGKGIGFEACRLLLDYATRRLGLHRVRMGMTARNTAMVKIAEKLGMKKEGILKDALFKDGRYLDIVEYAVVGR